MAIVIKQKASRTKTSATNTISNRQVDKGKDIFESLRQFRLGSAIKTKEIIFFYSQLALMLEIGSSLTQSLKAVGAQTKNTVFKEIIEGLLKDIEEGRQISGAMRRHPKVFPHIIISMIKAGETGGFLKDTIESIVEMQEKRQAFMAQLRSTLTYPAVLCIMGFVVVVFVLVGLLPKFMVLFEGKESLLPVTTRFLMFLSKSIQTYWWAYISGGVGLILGAKAWFASDYGSALTERLAISTPIIARLTNKIYTAQLLRTMGNLMDCKVPLLEALDVTRATFGNRYFRAFIDEIKENIEQGGKFSRPFASNPYILESAKQMVATGEEAGNLATVMLRLAKFYDTEVERELKTVSSLIEPIALIILGAVIGMIVSSVILPLFKIASAVQ
jgi:type II secretory pathway component PulF